MMSEKWTIAFKLLDFNKDGVISVADMDDCKKSFLEVYKLPEGQSDSMQMELCHFWDKSIFLTDEPDWGKTFTLDDVLKSREEAYARDPAVTKATVHESMMHLVQAADTNKAGSFSYEEFQRLHFAFNIKDENLVKGLFEIIGANDDGRCSLESVAGFYTELTMGNDEDKHQLYKSALAACGFM